MAMDVHVHRHAHLLACVCVYVNLSEYVQMSAHMCTYQARQMRMTDVSVFVHGKRRGEWGVLVCT